MHELTSDQVQKCVEISFVLEPVLDKKDCTTRYVDLDHKPLADFLIAAINVSNVFQEYAKSVSSGNKDIYSHLLQAMEISNNYKSEKNINFGLLVFMFVAVRSRMTSESLEECLRNIPHVIANSSKQDVTNYLDGFSLNSQTSRRKFKKQTVREGYEKFYKNDNLLDLFSFALTNVFKDTTTTSHQVCKEFVEGFPTVSKFVSEIDEKKGLLLSLTDSFNALHKESSELSVGFLSDLTAAALFLYISYRNPETYIVR